MKNLYKKVVILIITGIFLIALPIEIYGLIQNQKTFKTEAEGKLEYKVKCSGAELNLVFNSMENLVNMMRALVKNTFTGDTYITNYETFTRKKNRIGLVLKETLEDTTHIAGFFVTFTPKLHTGQEEIWYSYKNGKVTFIDARQTVSKENWLKKDNKRVKYYYDAIKYGSYWGGISREASLGKYMTSHTKSVYDDYGNLIGIVGANMFMTEVKEILKTLKTNNELNLSLFGPDMSFYASSDYIKNPNVYFSYISDKVKDSKKNTGYFWYKNSGQKKCISAYTKLNNGWILVATQPEKTVMTSAADTRKTLLITMLLTIVVIIGFTAVLIRRYYGPVVESAEQNEIIIINQSRQAKLGEMIGNIAHQCKQPLNSINIDIANMKDDYYASELSPENFDRYTEKMKDNITIMSDTITDFADFLKPDRKKETFLINDVIEKVLSMMAESLKINKIKVEFNADRKISVTNYRNELTQCIFNILENARDAASASPPDARQISIELSEDFAEKMIHINIFNTGSVISEEAGRHIFTPYFSTKEAKGGTGLGLYLTKQIIENHFNGRVYYTNNDEGVTFTIEFKEI